MNILVIGATGNVGSPLVPELIKRGAYSYFAIRPGRMLKRNGGMPPISARR